MHDMRGKQKNFSNTAPGEMEEQQRCAVIFEAHHQQLLAEANADVQAQRHDQAQVRMRMSWMSYAHRKFYLSLKEEKEGPAS